MLKNVLFFSEGIYSLHILDDLFVVTYLKKLLGPQEVIADLKIAKHGSKYCWSYWRFRFFCFLFPHFNILWSKFSYFYKQYPLESFKRCL